MGAGTAGCVLANRLSENSNNKILLIEAGNTFGPLSTIPIAATLMQGTSIDWSFKTISQQYSSKGLFNNQQILPRGKGLGGSSQINYLLHYDGKESDFDLWEKYAGELWSYKNLKNYLIKDKFQKNCNDEIQSKIKSSLSNDENVCYVKNEKSTKYDEQIIYDYNELNDLKLGDILIEAGNELKYEIDEDNYFRLDEDERIKIGIKLASYNVKNGKRFGVYQQYLQSIFNRTNLHIMMNTRVHKVK